MSTTRTKTIRKRIWSGDAVRPTDMAEHARDVAAAVDEVDGKLVIATFKDTVFAPPLFIATQGRFPAGVIPGSAQGKGFVFAGAFGSTFIWDFYNSQVRISQIGGLIVGNTYTFSILLFFGGA